MTSSIEQERASLRTFIEMAEREGFDTAHQWYDAKGWVFFSPSTADCWRWWQAARRAPVVPKLTLPIQAGKKYLRRDGKRVIVDESHAPWKEQGLILALVIGDGQTWAHVSAETGRYSDADCDEDLVADYIAAAPQPPEAEQCQSCRTGSPYSCTCTFMTDRNSAPSCFEAAPVQLPEPAAEVQSKLGTTCMFSSTTMRKGDKIYTEQQVRQLLEAHGITGGLA